MFAELNSTAGLGPVIADRHRRHLPGDGDPAAGAAGDLRPLDLLAVASRRSARTSRPRPASGPGSATGSRPRRGRSGSAPRPCSRVACLGLFALDTAGLSIGGAVHHRSSTRSSARRCSSTHGARRQLATPIHGRRQRRRRPTTVAAAMEGVEGIGEPSGARDPGRRRPRRRHRSRPTSPRRGVVRHRRGVARRGARRRRVPIALVGGTVRGVYLDIEAASDARQQGDHPDRAARGVADPDAAAAGAGVAADPDRDGGAVLRRRAWHLGADLRVRLRLRPVPTRRSRCSRSCSWSPSASTTTSS